MSPPGSSVGIAFIGLAPAPQNGMWLKVRALWLWCSWSSLAGRRRGFSVYGIVVWGQDKFVGAASLPNGIGFLSIIGIVAVV